MRQAWVIVASCLLLAASTSGSPTSRTKLHKHVVHQVAQESDFELDSAHDGSTPSSSEMTHDSSSAHGTHHGDHSVNVHPSLPKTTRAQAHQPTVHHRASTSKTHHSAKPRQLIAADFEQVESGLQGLAGRVSKSSLPAHAKAKYANFLQDLEASFQSLAAAPAPDRGQLSTALRAKLPELQQLLDRVKGLEGKAPNGIGQRVPQESVPAIASAIGVISHLSDETAGRLSDKERENLAAVGDDLELLAHSDDVQANSDLVKAISLRLPAIQKLEEKFGAVAPSEPTTHTNAIDTQPKAQHTLDRAVREGKGPSVFDEAVAAVIKSNLSLEQKTEYAKALKEMRNAFSVVEQGGEVSGDGVSMDQLVRGVDVLRRVEQAMAKAALSVGERSVTVNDRSTAVNEHTVNDANTNTNVHTNAADDEDDVVAKRVVGDQSVHETLPSIPGKAVDVGVVAANGLDKIKALNDLVTASNIPADKKNKFLANLQGLERDTRALRDPKLSEAQKMDLESAMKLRVTMLKDMEQYMGDMTPRHN